MNDAALNTGEFLAARANDSGMQMTGAPNESGEFLRSQATDTGEFLAESAITFTPASGISARTVSEMGDRIGGRYVILGLLGEGGMGSVYRVRDTELGEIVALKMLRHDSDQSDEALERLRSEVKLARKVTHQNVARMYDIGEHGGERFLTMECIDGETLSSILAREGKLALPRVIEVIKGICAGLDAAHAACIVHRDLKPDNVLMTKDGRPVITDFGIARERSTHDVSGIIAGTPEYMAPEQVEGAIDLDARADIYALGVMLYEMLTARRPWSRSTPLDTAMARLGHPPPDPTREREDLPAAMARIVMRCMAENRDDRYSSAVEVVAALSHIAMTTFGVASAAAAPLVAARPAKEKTLAVLPFRNIGPAQDDFVAEGFWEDVLDALSMTKGIRVKPRSVVAKFKNAQREPREIGDEMGVQVVVEGSLRRTPRGFRISTRAISVGDDFQLWAGRFDKPEEDLLVVGDEVAKAIANAVTAELSTPAREAVTDARAIELYLRAREEYRKYWADSVTNSLQLFEQALEIAPNDPTILAGYAMAWSRLSFFLEGINDRARDAAIRAVQAAPHVGGPYVALGYAYLQAGNTAEALRSCKLAIQRAPGLAEGYAVLGMILSEIGPIDDAQTWSEAALSHDVNVQFGINTTARIHAFRGRWHLLDPLFARVSGAANLRTARIRFALWQNDLGLAQKYKDEIKEMNPANRLLLGIARVMLERRPTQEVPELRQAIMQPGGGWRRQIFYQQIAAETAAYIGDVSGTLEALQRATNMGLIDLLWLDHCPLFGDVRENAQFVACRSVVETRARGLVGVYREH